MYIYCPYSDLTHIAPTSSLLYAPREILARRLRRVARHVRTQLDRRRIVHVDVLLRRRTVLPYKLSSWLWDI